MSKVTRTTISVPTDLKARMDAAGEPVNWSSVACRAFEVKLAEISARKTHMEKQDVINRLRATRVKAEEENYTKGVQHGRNWAMRFADAGVLERLAELDDDQWRGEFDAYGVGGAFHSFVCPDEDHGRSEAAEFFTTHGDAELMYDCEYVSGFADGAVQVWREVEDEV